MTDSEFNVYGMSVQDIREDYMEGITAKFCGLEMVVAGILSDSQFALSVGDNENARKQMNIAKFILSEMMITKRAEEIA